MRMEFYSDKRWYCKFVAVTDMVNIANLHANLVNISASL